MTNSAAPNHGLCCEVRWLDVLSLYVNNASLVHHMQIISHQNDVAIGGGGVQSKRETQRFTARLAIIVTPTQHTSLHEGLSYTR